MCVLSRGALAPSRVAVAPVVEFEIAGVGGHADGCFPEELPVGVKGYFFGGPVEAVFMVAVVGAEIDDGGVYLAFDGVDYQPDGGFVGFFLFAGEELDVDFLGVVVVLRKMLLWSSSRP